MYAILLRLSCAFLVSAGWSSVTSINFVDAADSFDFDLANATLAVVVDRRYRPQGKGHISTMESIKGFISSSSQLLLRHSGLNVDFYDSVDILLRPDLTAVLSLADCDSTWKLFYAGKEDGLLHFAITDADCPRLPASTAITVPLCDRGGDLPQMVLDLKTARVLTWGKAVILHDESIGPELLDRLIGALSADAPADGGASSATSISTFRVPHDATHWKRRKRIEDMLNSLPLSGLGSCFLVLVTYDLVGIIMDVAKTNGLVHPKSQWLYVLADSDAGKDSLNEFISLLGEGDNVAFVSNNTALRSNCEGGLLCHADELVRSFLLALDRSVQDERDLASQVSDEEWEVIRPSKEDHTALLLAHIKDHLRGTGRCDNCTAWRMRAGDTWGLSYASESRGQGQGQGEERGAASTRPERPRAPLVSLPVLAGPPAPTEPPDTSGSSSSQQFSLEDSDELLDEHLAQPRVWLRRQRPRRGAHREVPESEEESNDLMSSMAARPGSRRPSRTVSKLVPVGWWSVRDGLNMDDVLFPHAQHGFKGRRLPLASVHNPPWQIITVNESGHVVEYKGLVFEIINELSKSLNFTVFGFLALYQRTQKNSRTILRASEAAARYTVLFPLNKGHGFLNASNYYLSKLEAGEEASSALPQNISWSKMIEAVQQNKVFLGAAALTVTAERKQMINFTLPISIQPYQFLVVRPRELSRALLFMSPFTSTTWLCIALSVAAIGPVLNYIHRASPYYDYFGKRSTGGLFDLTNCLWYAYGALLQQGGAHLPDADSGRLVVGTWWLMVLVLVTTYCGNLVAALTFPRIEASIRSAQEMLEHRDAVTWGFPSDSPLLDHLKASNEPKLLSILEGAVVHDREAPALESVRGGTHVYIDWRVNLLRLMRMDFEASNRCDFSLMAIDDFVEEQVAMFLMQSSPYLEIINDEIRRMHQVGLIHKWIKDYLPKKDRCWSISNTEANNHSVNLRDMQGSFFVLFLGFLLSGFLIVIECLWRKRKIAAEKQVIKPFVA